MHVTISVKHASGFILSSSEISSNGSTYMVELNIFDSYIDIVDVKYIIVEDVVI